MADDAGAAPPKTIDLYIANLSHVPRAMSALLESYATVAPEDQKTHITAVRERAYASHPYPCLGRWRFLELDLASHPLYQTEILAPLARPSADDTWIFLDLGTCLGQDIRKLVFDGADPRRVYGADLRPEFINAGYALFRDAASFPRDHFVAPADLFDASPSSELSRRCDGRVGILHVCAVFHLFNLDDQMAVARRCLRLLDPARKRVLVCGAQVGNVDAREYARRGGPITRFHHNEHSWRTMWETVVAEKDWADRVQAVEVQCVLEERNWESSQGADDAINNRRQIGQPGEGFRWMKWWVWVVFK